MQREVAEHIVAALDAGGGSMDQLCRLLLAADSYSVVLLRNYCLAGLAQAFHSLQRHTSREQAIFEAFVDAVAPKVYLLQIFLSQLHLFLSQLAVSRRADKQRQLPDPHLTCTC